MPEINVKGLVNRVAPSVTADGSYTFPRLNRYGEPVVAPSGRFPVSDEGQYFVATSSTPGTALGVSGVVTAYSATVDGLLYIFNNDSAGTSAKRLYLDYIKIIVTVAPASGTSWMYSLEADNTNRYSSGGIAVTPVNPNMDSGVATIAKVYAPTGGTVITLTTATAAKRIVGVGRLRSVIPIAQDVLVLVFGRDSLPGGNSGATGAARYAESCPPVVLGPQQGLALNAWSPSNSITGPSFELDMGWWER